MKKLLIGTGIAGLLAITLVVALAGFGVVSTAFAQGPWSNQNGAPGFAACHDNSAVLQVLGLTQQDLLSQRQAGKSLLDIAKAKNVDEAKLTDALMQPVSAMHNWMAQNLGNKNSVDQMTQAMREWIAKDIRETKLGTMTDYRLGLSNNGAGFGMMGGYNGHMGPGMMGGQYNTPNGRGGMMGGWGR